jgi:hypothetical protein
MVRTRPARSIADNRVGPEKRPFTPHGIFDRSVMSAKAILGFETKWAKGSP